MYTFCFQRGLREVWGYMWTSWYAPKKWALWARSTTPYLCRLRTTMTVENFWRYLKHETLHHLLHPRLDQLLWLLITDVGPRFDAKMQKFDVNYRPGRANELSPFQKSFKANWQKLQARPLGTTIYTVSIRDWTCTCGQQKYNAFCLCKHLVQAVEDPDPRFFREVVRRRTIPFYRHPLLIPKGEDPLSDLEDGCITDGDDRPRRYQTLMVMVMNLQDPLGSSSPIRMDDNDEHEEHAERRARLRQRAQDLIEAGRLLNEQLDLDSKIWLKSVDQRNVGSDAAFLVEDVRKFAVTGRRRETTWARRGDRHSARYTSNTMGYQVPLMKEGAVAAIEMGADVVMGREDNHSGDGRSLGEAIEID
ncbi:hypothetical protein BDZ89DRAFT_1102529 [Hymenopellis radicata]|nr:hypothetical protein BDZ89DRAFT_1102529 [Hymenopellis radicata]